MPFILASYYTENSIYATAAASLVSSAEKLGVRCYSLGIPDRGGWCENTEYKPYFVRDCMRMFPDHDIVYTDADSMLHSYPSLFDDTDAEILIRRQVFPWRTEFMSGTFFMRNNEDCSRVVDSWINKVAAGKTRRVRPDTWEQYHLGQAIVESGMEWKQLPHEYIYFDHIERVEGHVENPVFTHMQYSRKTADGKR